MNEIVIDTEHIQELAKGLEELPTQLKQVTSLAINRTIDVMRTEAAEEAARVKLAKKLKVIYGIRE